MIKFENIDGLIIIQNVFTPEQEAFFIEKIESRKEKEKHTCDQIHKATEYGWKFIPIEKNIYGTHIELVKNKYLGMFPDWLQNIWNIANIKSKKSFTQPDHVLINEYQIGDGCKKHTDDIKFWKNSVLGVSLGSGCNMEYEHSHIKHTIWIPPRSIYILEDDARYEFTHHIPSVTHDIVYGDKIARTKRISLTFREIHDGILSQQLRKECPTLNHRMHLLKRTYLNKGTINVNNINPIFIPSEINLKDTPIERTRFFLKYTIGSYIEINIKDKMPDIEIFINQDMIDSNALSDNARCYTKHSVPALSREHEYVNLFSTLCETKNIKDCTLFFAIGDFPIVMKDRTKHPYPDRYSGAYDMYPKDLLPIYSRSIIPNKHDDLLFPTRDVLELPAKIKSIILNEKKFVNKNFIGKKSIAVFKGSFTGNDRSLNNTRLHAKILSLEYSSYFDISITENFKYYMYENFNLCTYTQIDNKKLLLKKYKGIPHTQLTILEQSVQYKYILHIDGFVSAWRLGEEMLSYSTILKVDSPWVEHYYHKLIPWVHFIPIKTDLSDLVQRIEWCKQNDVICEQIAKNAFEFAINEFTENNLLNYMEILLKNNSYDYTLQSVRIPEFDITLPKMPNKEKIFNTSGIKCIKYHLSSCKKQSILKKIYIKQKLDVIHLFSHYLHSLQKHKLIRTMMITEKNIKKLDSVIEKLETPFIATDIACYNGAYYQMDDFYDYNLNYSDILKMAQYESFNVFLSKVIIKKELVNEIGDTNVLFVRNPRYLLKNIKLLELKEDDFYNFVLSIKVLGSNIIFDKNQYTKSNEIIKLASSLNTSLNDFIGMLDLYDVTDNIFCVFNPSDIEIVDMTEKYYRYLENIYDNEKIEWINLIDGKTEKELKIVDNCHDSIVDKNISDELLRNLLGPKI